MLYNKVVEFCKKEGIPVYVFEKECGLGNGTIRGWKNSSPSVENLKKVADYFDITVDELISEM